NGDGSTTTTISNTTVGGGLRDKVVETTSAAGLSTNVVVYSNGDADIDLTQTKTINLNADGTRSTTLSKYDLDGTLLSRSVETSSASRLSTTLQLDTNGDGVVDKTWSDVMTLNVDGTRTETLIATNVADGSLIGQTTTTVSADGRTKTTQVDEDGNGTIDRTMLDVVLADGSETRTINCLNPDGSIKLQHITTESFDGHKTNVKMGPCMRGAPARLPDASGGYSGIRSIQPTPSGSTVVTRPAYASHTVDASGIDLWIWNEDTASHFDSAIQIDLATEGTLVDLAARLYDTVFDREMFTSERQFLAKYIVNGTLNSTQLVNDLMNSAEFTQRYGTLSNAQFIEQIHHNAFGHFATVADLSGYLSKLTAAQMSWADAVISICESAEHLGFGNADGSTTNYPNNPAAGELPFFFEHVTKKNPATNIVRQLFDAALRREPDASEFDSWTQQLMAGTATNRSIAQNLVDSDEFLMNYGEIGPGPNGGRTLSDAAFVTVMMLNALNRIASDETTQGWTALLGAGQLSRADLLAGFAESIDHLGVNRNMIVSEVSYTLPDTIANLTLIGASLIDGMGNGLDNIIMGNSA